MKYRISGTAEMIIARRSRPKPKAQPLTYFGVVDVIAAAGVDGLEDGGIDHAAAGELEPAVAAQRGGLDVDLEARLGEREKMRAETNLRGIAQKLAEEKFNRALEVGERDPFIDVKAFHLRELRQVRGVDFIAAIRGARGR